MLVEREWLLVAWALVLSAWIVWRDVRPFISSVGKKAKQRRLADLGAECIALSRAILETDKRTNAYEHYRAQLYPITIELFEAGIDFPLYDDNASDGENANRSAMFLATIGQFLKNGRYADAKDEGHRRFKASLQKRLPPPSIEAGTQPKSLPG